MARSTQRRIYYHHCLWGKLSTTCSNATTVAKWATPSYSRPRPAPDNGGRDGRSTWLAVTPTPVGSTPKRLLHCCTHKSVEPLPGIDLSTFSIRGNHLVYVANIYVVRECLIFANISASLLYCNCTLLYPISHATLWAWFNITKLLANLLTEPSVFLFLCQLYIL